MVIGGGFVCKARPGRRFLVRLFYRLFGLSNSSPVGVIDEWPGILDSL